MRVRSSVFFGLVIAVPIALIGLQFCNYSRQRSLAKAISEGDSRAKAQEIALRLKSLLSERDKDMEVLALIWGLHSGEADYGHFVSVAEGLISGEVSYHTINYVDETGLVRASVPGSQGESLIGTNLKGLPGRSRLFSQASASDVSIASPPMSLVGDHYGFAIWKSIRSGPVYAVKGFVAAAILMDDLIASILREDPLESFACQVSMDGQVVYGDVEGQAKKSAMEYSFQALGVGWKVVAWPLAGSAQARIEKPLGISLIAGICLILLISFLLLALIMTNRRLASTQAQLRESEDDLRITLNSIGDAVIATDVEGKVQSMNPVAEGLTGWAISEAKGRYLDEVFSIMNEQTKERAESPVERVLKSGQVVGLDNHTVLVAKDGGARAIADSGSPIRDGAGRVRGLVLVFRDVSSEYDMQEQLRQSQKLEAVGQLAGGLAHDLNNMLGGIMGAAELLDQGIEEGSRLKKYCRIILDASERASSLNQKLLAFTRKKPATLNSIDAQVPLRAAMELLQGTADPRIRIDLRLSAQGGLVRGDPAQLQSAFLNLGLNAVQAMPEGGTLTVTSALRLLEGAECHKGSFELSPGPYLEISIIDDGCGIDPVNLGHIFEPFFTTKAQGQGTGLGLSAVYGTVRSHKGAISVQSELGKGSSFSLLLPLEDQGQERTEKTRDESMAVTTPAQARGRILYVEDEEVMRVTGKTALEGLGYEVTTAKDGEDGLLVFQARPGEFDLVILDMIMPRMNGRDCYARIRAIRPEVKAIMVSGFARQEEIDALMAIGVKAFLAKPFRLAELSATVGAWMAN